MQQVGIFVFYIFDFIPRFCTATMRRFFYGNRKAFVLSSFLLPIYLPEVTAFTLVTPGKICLLFSSPNHETDTH